MNEAPRHSTRTKSPPHIATLILLAGISALAMNIFLPSLPRMAAFFETDFAVMQLSVSLYLAVNAVLQILIGPISDFYGRRPVILWGLTLFCLATLGCLLAPNATWFLIFRMAQSCVAVALVIGRAAVRDQYDTDRAASMIGYVTMGMAVVPMIGPAIGGAMEAALGWKSTFWLLLALGLGALTLAHVDFGETRKITGLTLHQQLAQFPDLLRSPRFWGYSLACGLSSGAFFSYLGGAAYVGEVVYGLDPVILGVYFGAPALGYFLGNFISGLYSVRLGINRMVLWGCLICVLGLVPSMVITAMGLGSAISFFGLMTFVGVGNGLTIPNATAGALSVRPHLAATASGLSGAIMLGLGAMLSAFAGTLLHPDSSGLSLLALMNATSALSVVAILLVIRRQRQLGI